MASYYRSRKITKTVMMMLMALVVVVVLMLVVLMLVLVVVVVVMMIMALVLMMVIVASEPYSSQCLTLRRKRLTSLTGSYLDVPGCYLTQSTSLPTRLLSRDVNPIVKSSLRSNSLLCKKSL